MTLLKLKPRFRHSIPSSFNKTLDALMNDYNEKGKVVKGFTPEANILENETEYVIQLALPGLNKNDIEINLDENILKIQGEKKTQNKKDNSIYHLRQYKSGKFSRSFYLTDEIIYEEIKASLENGILELTMPKVEHIDSKRSVEIG